MRLLFAGVAAVGILALGGVVTAQWWPFGSGESADVRVERLRSQNETLMRENERLSTEKENLQGQLKECQLDCADQENLALENERLRGELERARIDAAAESARREQLERELNRRNGGTDRGDRGDRVDVLGWLAFVGLLALAGLALWRERWWSSRVKILTMARVVDSDRDAIARRATDVASIKIKTPEDGVS